MTVRTDPFKSAGRRFRTRPGRRAMKTEGDMLFVSGNSIDRKMYFRLSDRIALRSWKQVECAVYERNTPYALSSMEREV